ncbi:hypothetical protein ACER0A_013450 [Haloimpatiens sp. FM7315]|uniref:hypothetical protein n=1 Tax=Haloimpatiens sp. FM7315 TaxID=3298609 RepID=UPI0035A2BB80
MRKNKYTIIIITLFFISFLLASCKNKEVEFEGKEITFDNSAANLVVENYFAFLMKEDYESVKKLFSDDMIKEQGRVTKEDMVVRGFRIDEITELSKMSIFKIMAVSENKYSPYSILDEYRISVIKEKNGYKISEVKVIMKKETFAKNQQVRIRDENNVDTYLVLALENLPKTAFSKEDKLSMYKKKVPSKEFKAIGLSYDGLRMAISSYNGDSYLGLVTIDESLAVQGAQSQGQESSSGQGQSGNSAKEKPIGKEITSLDVIKGCHINYMVFSRDEKYLAMQYTKDDGSKCIKVYESDSGDLIPIKFEETFPVNKVNIKFNYFDSDGMIIEVLPRESLNAEQKDLIGIWKIDLKNFKIKRL